MAKILSVKIDVMKILNGLELVGYIKERQAKQARSLRQSWRVIPRLAIIRTGDSPVTDTYLRLKHIYGDDISVEVKTYDCSEYKLFEQIAELNSDENVQSIIIQLPLLNQDQTNAAVNAVVPEKDVDGLGDHSKFTPATAMAIDWLMAGYNVTLTGKKIAIIGNGKLVGAPLYKLWKTSGLDVSVYDEFTQDLAAEVINADIIVTATGRPGLITNEMVKYGAVVVDAGTASENGVIVGDVAADVRNRSDLTITPIKGGVGPLTVAALFDNVITAARKIADQNGQQDL